MFCLIRTRSAVRSVSIKAAILMNPSLEGTGYEAASTRSSSHSVVSTPSNTETYTGQLAVSPDPAHRRYTANSRLLQSSFRSENIADQHSRIQRDLLSQNANENDIARYFYALLYQQKYQEVLSDWEAWKASMKAATRIARLTDVRNSVLVAFMCQQSGPISSEELNSKITLCFQPMKPPKVAPGLHELLKDLKFSEDATRKILEVAEAIEKEALMPNTPSFLAGLDNLFSHYRSDEAWGVYEQIKKHDQALNTASYHKFVLGFVGVHKLRFAQLVFQDMRAQGIRPEPAFWNAMLNHAGDKKDLAQLQKIWKQMKAENVPLDTIISTTLINGYFNCAAPDLALAVLQDMANDRTRPPNTVTCNVVVKGLIHYRGPEVALDFLTSAADTGMVADSFSYNLLFKSFLDRGDTARTKIIDAKLKSAGVRDVASYTILIDHILKKTSFDNAIQDKLHAVLRQMKNEGIKTNAYIYSTIIKHALHSTSDLGADSLALTSKHLQVAESWLAHMMENSVPRTVVIYELLIRGHVMYGSDPRTLFRLWEDMRRDRISADAGAYNIMIKGLTQNHLLSEAFTLFEKSLNSGHQPGPNTLAYLLNTAAAQRRKDIATLVLEYMVKTKFRVMSDGLARALERASSIGCNTSRVISGYSTPS